MPFPRQQPRSGIETDPTGSGNIGFGPGMEVGEVFFRTGRSGQRLLVGDQLEQVPGNESGRESEGPENLD
jgi:hypothetical protein